MVKCFAPGCRNRQANSNEKIYLFKPSTNESIVKWANEIPRSDRPFGKNDYLCAKHFDQKDIIRAEIIDNVLYKRTHPTLVKNAIPKYFENPTKVINTSKQHTGVIKTIIKKPTRVCIVCNCSEVFENGRTICYYLFPINPELRKEWIRAAHLNNSNFSQFSYLCSKHFEENCFESVSLGTLKEDAVPSRFNFTTKASSSISAISSSDTDIPFCIVKSCQHKGNMRGITYHKIPTNNYENWLKVLKNFTKIDPIPLNSRVCSMHFKAKDFLIQGNKIKLNNGALPKLHITEYLLKNSSNPLSMNETEEENANNFNDECGVKKLRQEVLLSSVITPAADIVKSDFALIDINSIINKKIDNELKNTISQNRNKSTQNLTIIKAMHNYCNADIDKIVSNENNAMPVAKKIVNVEKNNVPQLETNFINKNTILDENNDEDKKKKSLIRKLRAYKKAYKKHKSINRKQSDNILILENKLEENMKKNKKLEQRIVILEDLIQNMLKKREEYIIDMDKLEN